MNKTARISLIAGAVALTACIGVTALAGCKDNTPVDHFANMSATDFYTINNYVTRSTINFPNPTVIVDYNYTNGEIYQRYTLKYNVSNAYFNIDAVLDLGENETFNLKGQAWLEDRNLYIDNGKEQFYVTYRETSYIDAPDNALNEQQLFNKYLALAIKDISTSTPKNPDFINEFEMNDLWKYCKFFASVEDDNHYFKISYYENENTLTDDALTSVATDYMLYIKNFHMISFETRNTTVEGENTYSESAKYQNSSETISMPNNYKNWQKK